MRVGAVQVLSNPLYRFGAPGEGVRPLASEHFVRRVFGIRRGRLLRAPHVGVDAAGQLRQREGGQGPRRFRLILVAIAAELPYPVPQRFEIWVRRSPRGNAREAMHADPRAIPFFERGLDLLLSRRGFVLQAGLRSETQRARCLHQKLVKGRGDEPLPRFGLGENSARPL